METKKDKENILKLILKGTEMFNGTEDVMKK